MGKRRNGLLVLAMIAVLALVAAACGDDDGGGETGSTTGASGATGATALSGTIVISGSSTVLPISSLVAELFNEDVSSDVSITVDGPGTGDGFVLFCDGETDISDASRPIEPEEADACAANGIEYVELPVAFDGITVMTNPANADVTLSEQRRPLRAVRPRVRRDRHVGRRRLAGEEGGRQRRLPERTARDHGAG